MSGTADEWVCIDFYWVFIEFDLGLELVFMSFRKYYRVLLIVNEFDSVSPDFIEFFWVFVGFTVHSVSLGSNGIYWILLGSNGFYWGFTWFYWVLLVFTGFYWFLLVFTGFYWVLLGSNGLYFFLSLSPKRKKSPCPVPYQSREKPLKPYEKWKSPKGNVIIFRSQLIEGTWLPFDLMQLESKLVRSTWIWRRGRPPTRRSSWGTFAARRRRTARWRAIDRRRSSSRPVLQQWRNDVTFPTTRRWEAKRSKGPMPFPFCSNFARESTAVTLLPSHYARQPNHHRVPSSVSREFYWFFIEFDLGLESIFMSFASYEWVLSSITGFLLVVNEFDSVLPDFIEF